jgi:hypothetical protein
MVHFIQEKDQLLVSFQWKSREITPKALHLTATNHVEAKYMIEPVMN